MCCLLWQTNIMGIKVRRTNQQMDRQDKKTNRWIDRQMTEMNLMCQPASTRWHKSVETICSKNFLMQSNQQTNHQTSERILLWYKNTDICTITLIRQWTRSQHYNNTEKDVCYQGRIKHQILHCHYI